MRRLITIGLLSLLGLAQSHAQEAVGRPGELPANSSRSLSSHDSLNVLWIDTTLGSRAADPFTIRNICKGYQFVCPLLLPLVSFKRQPVAQNPPLKDHVPLLQVSGNIMYDVNYRSRIDTPYAENNVYQHTLQTRLDFLYKGKYPFRIYITNRFGNSSLFRKYTDLNFHYAQQDFVRILKSRIMQAAESYVLSKFASLDSIRRLIQSKRDELNSFKHQINKPNLLQQMVEERERAMYQTSYDEIPSLNQPLLNIHENLPKESKGKPLDIYSVIKPGKGANNTINEVQKLESKKDSLESKASLVDSLTAQLDTLEKKYEKIKSSSENELGDFRRELENEGDVKKLAGKLKDKGIPDSILPKGYQTLFALKTFNIGRSIANYTELTVKDISITGVQIEYNPHQYYAFAAGKVDYRFRDYIVPNNSASHQYVAMARYGFGLKNGNHIIISYYTGKRQFFNSSISTPGGAPIPEYHLAGLSIEGLYKLTRNIALIGEIAKSTIPYYSLDSLQRKSWRSSLTGFNNRSNEAYSVRLNAYIPETQTRISGNLRYIGANFQSFSTFTTGSAQTLWTARVEQPFFKRKLNVISSVQKNDYENPFIATSYKSSALLASIQASLRIKKWPVLTAGYYPSYQLMKTGDQSYAETRYYTMMGSASYYYQWKKVQFTSYAVYSRFYNEANDTGFVYFNSKNLLLSHTTSIDWFSTVVNASLSASTGYSIYTLENNSQFMLRNWISVGAGAKMIRYTLVEGLQWGYSANMTIRMKILGDIQLMMDKGFLPGINRQLVPSKMGRLTYYKTF